MARCVVVVALMVVLAACGAKPVPVAADMDEALVGAWRPVSLAGRVLSDEDRAASAYVIRGDGVATLVVKQPLGRYAMYQKLAAHDGVLSVLNLTSRKTAQLPYTIDGDELTIGEGEAKQVYERVE